MRGATERRSPTFRRDRMTPSSRSLSGWLLLLLAVATVPVESATGDSTRLVPALLLDATGRPRTSVTAADLIAVERGLAEPVLAVERTLRWSVTVWVSLPASRPEGVEASARLLGERAAALAALGPVEVVVAEAGFADPLGGPTRDPDELRRIFADLELEASGAGELLELRRGYREELIASDGDDDEQERLALDALREELLLVDDERTTLLAWLADAAAAIPDDHARLLVLVAGAPLEADASLYAGAAANRRGALAQLLAETAANATSDPGLGPLLGAAGWTTVPLVTAGRDESAAVAPMVELARSSGAEVARGSAELTGVLDRLSQRVGVRVSLAGDGDGSPFPFALRPARGEGSVVATEWASAVPPEGLSAARARRLLLDGDDAGPLPVTAVLRLEEGAGSGARGRNRQLAAVEVLVELGKRRGERVPASTTSLRTTLVLERIDGRPRVVHRVGSGRDLAGADRLLLRATLPLADDVDRVGVLVEDLEGGTWGGAIAELADEPLRGDGGVLVTETLDLGGGGERADGPADAGAVEARSSVVRLLPPKERPATGRQRIQVLVTTTAVRAVDFYLDGEKIASDDRSPFAATLDLGDDVAPHTIRVVALDSAGLAVGADELRVNTDDDALRVTLVEVTPTADAVEVEAEVTTPPRARLARVELYYNDTLATRLDGPPYRARISRTAPGGGDYVTVVAHLTDGTRAEDVRLLDAPGSVAERIDVNLVQLFVVVTDRDGEPVRDLQATDFRVELGGETHAIERFGTGEDVPLLLGLMIDSSMSMGMIMHETKMAAIDFLGDILREDDRSFVVDFADQPRLVQTTSGELFTLVKSVSRLDPSGSNTALYDAIVFSLLQFGGEPGRKALVLLSDGDDVRSRFGYGRVYDAAKAAGLPIYILGIAGLDPERPSFRKSDLEGIAAASGGRVFYIDEQSQLGPAYDRIAAELRSQYLLTFTTDRELTDEEVAKVRVEVPGKRVETRTVIGDR